MFLIKSLKVTGFLILSLILFLSFSSILYAKNNFVLSKNSDFSTDDRVFTRGDTLFMRVTATDIDFTDIDENEFRLKPINGNDNDEFKGKFKNLLNGKYEASLDLASAKSGITKWTWRAKIEDNSGNKFKTQVNLDIVDGEQEKVTIKGIIQAVGGDSLVVNNIVILVDNQTIVRDGNGNLIALTDLKVGDMILIEAIINNNGKLVAQEINVEDDSVAEIEVRGFIDSIGNDSLVVLNMTFFVDANTKILNNDQNPISFDSLRTGLVVQIRADVRGDSSLLATRIKIEDDEEDEVEFTGFIDVITDTSIVVNGIFLRINNSTEILDDNNNFITPNELTVGQRVQIRGDIETDGVLRATRIKVDDVPPGNDEIEVMGAVTQIGQSFLVVAGLNFQVSANTLVLDNKNNPISLSDIMVGFVVEIRADVLADSTLWATKIKIEDSFNNEVEITGVITKIENKLVTVSNLEFVITENTIIVDHDNIPIGLENLHVGAVVEIRATVGVDGTLTATHIKLKDSIQNVVELTGTIDQIASNSFVVSGITFVIDSLTEIFDKDGNLLQFTDLSTGFLVEVRAELQPDGRLLATRIKIEDRIEDEVEVTGVIEAISATSITVLGRAFGVTENTVVFDNNNQLIDLLQLFVGQTVKVRGDLLPDGTLVAIKIKLEDDPANEIQVVGPIESLDPSIIVVIGIHFFVDVNTEFIDENNNTITMNDLKVGQTVEVRAIGQANGTRLATRVKIEDILLLSGVIDAIQGNGMTMVQQNVVFDAQTLILGRLNKFLTVNDLAVGQFVEVRAKMGSANTIFSTKVRVQELTTSIQPDVIESPEVPQNFVLLENYPNPFNPATTIRFKIPATAADMSVKAKLTIYNLLGQKVRTLFDESLSAGVFHSRQWDGKDDSGRRLASGILLYRLVAGNFVETRRMTLLK